MKFSECLKALIVRKMTTQAKVARGLGMSPANLSFKLKRGKITDEDLKQFADYLGCDFEFRFKDRKTGRIILEDSL